MVAPLRIGTRGSPLALAQAHETRDRLIAAHPDLSGPGAIEIVVIKTTGDRILDRTLALAGGKGLFTKELEEALDANAIDIAVHSMKDVPTFLPPNQAIVTMLPREDPRDAWFCPAGATLDQLPAGSIVGTASLRRQAQVLARRPDLKVEPLRGNVQTRLEKLAGGAFAATMLALAGLRRLGLEGRQTAVLEPEVLLPAVAQGAIGITARKDDAATIARVQPLNCAETFTRVSAERAFLTVLDGSCRTPIAALAIVTADGQLELKTQVLSPDGSKAFANHRLGAPADAEALGADAGHEIKALLPANFFAT